MCLILSGCHSVSVDYEDGKTILKVGTVGWGNLDYNAVNEGLLKENTTYEIIEVKEIEKKYVTKED